MISAFFVNAGKSCAVFECYILYRYTFTIQVQIGERVYTVGDTISFSNPLLDIKLDGQSRLLQLTQKLGGGRFDIRFLGTVVSG